jgi:ABC-type antimicrobial peptide transport system permease subunit
LQSSLEDKYKYILIQAQSVNKASFIIKTFLFRKGFTKDQFFLFSPQFILSWSKYELFIWSIALLLVSFILILISAGGVYSTLSIEVQSKLRQIGILRALGARKINIFFQFIMESLFLAITGWLAGLLLTVLSLPLLESICKFKVYIHTSICFISLYIMLISTLIASLLPAKRAAELLPAETLRYE